MYENPYQYLSGNIGDKKLIRAGFEEKLYDTGQVRLNYVVGPDNGPNLLLIPAQMGTWESYGKVFLSSSRYMLLIFGGMASPVGHPEIILGLQSVRICVLLLTMSSKGK